MSTPPPRYYVRLQVIEQTGFDEDNPQMMVIDSTTLAPPALNQSAAIILYNTVKNLLSLVKGVREYL